MRVCSVLRSEVDQCAGSTPAIYAYAVNGMRASITIPSSMMLNLEWHARAQRQSTPARGFSSRLRVPVAQDGPVRFPFFVLVYSIGTFAASNRPLETRIMR